jgi:hypothetical protein
VKGRKAWVEGHIEDTNGNILAEAKFVSNLPSPRFALHLGYFLLAQLCPNIVYIHRTMFVQPKYAKLLNTKALRQAMGEPEPEPWKKEPVQLAKGTNGPSSTSPA